MVTKVPSAKKKGTIVVTRTRVRKRLRSLRSPKTIKLDSMAHVINVARRAIEQVSAGARKRKRKTEMMTMLV
jgi:hypothetical protein